MIDQIEMPNNGTIFRDIVELNDIRQRAMDPDVLMNSKQELLAVIMFWKQYMCIELRHNKQLKAVLGTYIEFLRAVNFDEDGLYDDVLNPTLQNCT